MANQATCAGPVLVIDDDEDVREAIVEVLQDQRYPWLAASNGVEALEALRRAPSPCVILLDLMMPVMNGWEFRRALLADADLARVPVVVLSAHVDVKRAAEALGAAAHLGKPIQLERLMSIVGQHCGPPPG